MAVKYLLLILPTLALARIDIQLSGKYDPNNPDLKVDFSGSEVGIITDGERNFFKLDDEGLKDAVRAYFGMRPDEAYLRSPTPWGDLYQTYAWDQVKTTLVPRSAKILSSSSQPQIVMQQIFENNKTTPAAINVGISQEVQNTVSSSWSSGQSVGQEISYGFDIEGFTGGSTTFSFTSSWGDHEEKSQAVTVGSTSAPEILLQPGQAVYSRLQANLVSIKVEVEYVASLSGATALYYTNRYRGQHVWSLDISKVISEAGLSNQMVSKEVIDFSFYTDSKIIVQDKATMDTLLEVSV